MGKRYTAEQAYELGYALAYRGEMINGGNDAALHETKLGRATHAMWRAVEDVIVGSGSYYARVSAHYARGSQDGYAAAVAELKAKEVSPCPKCGIPSHNGGQC